MSTYHWCLGKSFAEILTLSNNTYEGSIIRCFRRLDELLRQMKEASDSIGNQVIITPFILYINSTGLAGCYDSPFKRSL